MRTPSGEVCTFATRRFPIRRADGSALVGGIAIDITAQEQANQEVRKLSRALEQSPVIVFITDAQGHLEYANRKYTEVTGREPEEVLGHVTHALDPEKTSPAEYRERWETVRAENGRADHAPSAGGRAVREYVKLSPILDADGALIAYCGHQGRRYGYKLTQAALEKTPPRRSSGYTRRPAAAARSTQHNLPDHHEVSPGNALRQLVVRPTTPPRADPLRGGLDRDMARRARLPPSPSTRRVRARKVWLFTPASRVPARFRTNGGAPRPPFTGRQ